MSNEKQISIEELYQIYQQHPFVFTDTRKLKQGGIFFALKGPNHNGNEFADKALDAGAAFTIIDDRTFVSNDKMILVADVLSTLQHLALHHRQKFQIPFIAITGSNGKTTTKELINAVLSTTYLTYTTEGNLNNHIGIPLTILGIKPDAEIAVIEMGANHLKEIESYCNYVMPTHGLITNCGRAHLEGFGDLEGVMKAKGELYDYLASHDGIAFVNKDLDYLISMSDKIPNVVTYGTHDASITGEVKRDGDFLKLSIKGGIHEMDIATNLVGDYNAANVLATVTVGNYFKVEPLAIKMALENYNPSNSRSQLLKIGSNTIILDAYNANPSSMAVAIENFAHMGAETKVLILGGMKEMGADSKTEHQKLIDLIDLYSWEDVVLVGHEFKDTSHRYLAFDNAADAKLWLIEQNFIFTHFLIKGSRSLKMEEVLEGIT